MAEMVRETGQTAKQIILDAVEERLADFHDLKIVEERMKSPEFTDVSLEELINSNRPLDDDGSLIRSAAK